MDDILEYLEEATKPEDLGPEYRELLKKLSPLNDIFQNATSIDLMNQWFFANADVMEFERQECFARGFRLGIQLILAALAEPSAPDIRHRSWARRSASPPG